MMRDVWGSEQKMGVGPTLGCRLPDECILETVLGKQAPEALKQGIHCLAHSRECLVWGVILGRVTREGQQGVWGSCDEAAD